MTEVSPARYLLLGPAADALATEAFGKLAPMLVAQTEAMPFTRLDGFDQTLRRSGRLLLDLGATLDLMLPDGSVLSQPAQGRAKFVTDLPDGPVKQALADLSPLRSLLPAGTGKLSHSTLTFVDADLKTHCRATLQRLTAAEGHSATLVTLRGLRGYDKAWTDLRRHLETCSTPFRIEALQSLLWPDEILQDAKPKLPLTPDQTVFDAATAIIARQIPIARRVEPGIIADHDTEFLHDYRVALRRIRSVLSLFKGTYQLEQTAALKTRFSALMAQTGPLRDLDVHLLEKQSFYDLLPASQHTGLDGMFALRAVERSKAHARLARQLRSNAHAQEMTDLAHLFATPQALPHGPEAGQTAYAFACALIWKRYRKIRQVAASINPQTPAPEVHALRIHCKKLRYLMEFFAGLFPAAAFKSLLKPLKTVQDHLGLVNDLSVQQVNLQTFLQGPALQGGGAAPHGTKLEVAQTVGALTTVLHQRQIEERQKTSQILSGFISPATDHTFRALFYSGKPAP